jgi:superfamily II DNA/RNA helicase
MCFLGLLLVAAFGRTDRNPKRRLTSRSTMNFDELNLAPAILKAVREQGYDTPTPFKRRPYLRC